MPVFGPLSGLLSGQPRRQSGRKLIIQKKTASLNKNMGHIDKNFSGIKADDMKFGLSLAGGMAYFNLGDVNSFIRSRADYYREESRIAGYPLSGDLQSLHFGLDSSAELLLFLTPRLALSLGPGYISASAGKGGGGMTVIETSDFALHAGLRIRF